MRRPLRLGLAGCGRLAERGYLPALALRDDVELVAVVDVDPARCRALSPGELQDPLAPFDVVADVA
jgi:predicted dehydrogenase